jgi:succinoglycan biosynthesis transport protein ExoP
MEQLFNISRLLNALSRYKWLIILVAVVAGATAFIFTAVKPSLHAATATIIIGNTQQKLTAVTSELQGGLEMTYTQDIGSQIEVMRSRGVLEQAITKLEPAKAADPNYLQAEVFKLQSALSIQQVKSTDLVSLTVVSKDPAIAEEQANAISEAYISEAIKANTQMIESSLVETTRRLGELQKNSVDLSISPILPRLTAQVDTALPALKTASKYLQQIAIFQTAEPVSQNASSANPKSGDAGTMITATELSRITQNIHSIVAEANELSILARNLKPVSISSDMASRSVSIAVLEGRTRALSTKISSLSAEIASLQQVEIDEKVRQSLLSVEEYLQVAGSAGNIILEQVVSLYKVQEQYMTPTADGSTLKSTSGDTDANLLRRITEHFNIMTANLNTAHEQVQTIVPRVPTMTQWKLQTLAKQLIEKTASVTDVLQTISTQLKPKQSGGEILLSQNELSLMEIRAHIMALSLNSMLTQLTSLESDGFGLDTNMVLFETQESLNVANNAVQEIGLEIGNIAESGGDTASYTALNAVRQQLQMAQLSSDTSSTRIVDTAVASLSGNVFSRYKNVLLAFIAGLLLSILAVLIIQFFDRTVRDASQVKSQLGLPLMANIAAVKDCVSYTPSILDKDSTQYLESFRWLRTNLDIDSAKGKVLLVTSPEEREGKTSIAANLARVVALQDRKVLLIDGNLRHPGVAAVFGLGEGKGLTELLTHADDGKNYLTKVDGVDILPAGAVSTQSAELFSSPRMKALIEKSRQNYDIVIMDSAPVIEWTDTRILAKNADGALIVLLQNVSKMSLATESKQALESIGIHVEGFVLNCINLEQKLLDDATGGTETKKVSLSA